MEYVYAAMLLHSAGKEINEDSIKNVLSSAGIEVDDVKVKALVNALKEVNIDEVINKAVSMPATVAVESKPEKVEEKKEEKKEEEKKEEEKETEVAQGLSALFG